MAYIGAGISRFNTADELTVTGDAQIDTTTLVVDSTNNRVGVGTASPATALDVTGTVTADGLTVDGISRFNNYINFGGTISTPQTAAAIYRPADNTLAFSTANTERLRITSSGNVLVGRTDSSSTTAGTVIYGGSTKGAITQAFAGRPLYINRLTTDGDIIEFAKDSTTVGHLGTSGGHMYFGCDDVGLIFRTNESIRPYNPGSTSERDAAIDLGVSSQRFKDLYLSNRLKLSAGGGIEFGQATTSASGASASSTLLDAYEEGTWTPGSSTGTISQNYATYTKIGRLVTVRCNVSNFSDRTTSTGIGITGLPFTSLSTQQAVSATLARFVNTGGDAIIAYIPGSSTTMFFYATKQNSAYAEVRHSHLSSSLAEFYLTISYEV